MCVQARYELTLTDMCLLCWRSVAWRCGWARGQRRDCSVFLTCVMISKVGGCQLQSVPVTASRPSPGDGVCSILAVVLSSASEGE